MQRVQISLQRASLEAEAKIEGSGDVVGICLKGQIHDFLAPASAGCQFLNPELAIGVRYISSWSASILP